MTLYKPTLIVKRLVAFRNGKKAYDETFHSGLNVLSGCNGGGKTSVIQLLTHSLGYEVRLWKDEAKECDNIFVGLEINGHPITLNRKNLETDKQPIDMCFKPYEEAIQSGPSGWKSFPYAVNQSRDSFSQKLFSLLGIPETKSDSTSNNLTIHQILRLIYSDQSQGSGRMFNAEPFDSALKRETIGNYLMGLHDDELYNAKLELVAQEKVLEKAVSKLQAIYSVVGKTSFSNDFSTIENLRMSYEKDIKAYKEEVNKIKEDATLKYAKEKGAAEKYAAESISTKNALMDCESNIQTLVYEIEDSNDFLAELADKASSIADSIEVGQSIPEIRFSYCPCCFKEIEVLNNACCHLCGSDTEENSSNTNLLRMKNEIDIQLRESNKLLKIKQDRLSDLQQKKADLRKALRTQINRASVTMTSLNASDERLIYELYSKIGETEEKIENLDRIAELYLSISELTNERDKAQEEVTRLKDILEKKSAQLNKRKPEIINIIKNHLIEILRSDVGSEQAFKSAKEIEFDFASDRISVNGKTAFSESGMVYLYNAFHISLLLASMDKAYSRLPRFMILDGIENGGMEDERSKNFQKVIREKLEDYSVECQVIIATKSIHSSLNSENFVIGKTFTEEHKSISI